MLCYYDYISSPHAPTAAVRAPRVLPSGPPSLPAPRRRRPPTRHPRRHPLAPALPWGSPHPPFLPRHLPPRRPRRQRRLPIHDLHRHPSRSLHADLGPAHDDDHNGGPRGLRRGFVPGQSPAGPECPGRGRPIPGDGGAPPSLREARLRGALCSAAGTHQAARGVAAQ